MNQCIKKYTDVRGFNFHADWGFSGIDLWLENFNPERYRELIKNGKQHFPGMTALRIWLSFSAWCKNPALCLANMKKAGEIISEENLDFIPVYFNGCLGVPLFDVFTAETLFGQRQYTDFKFFKKYVKAAADCFKGQRVLMHDIANEPFNNVGNVQSFIEIVRDFMEIMANEIRTVDDRPITVGSQGFPWQDKAGMTSNSKWLDIDLLNPFVDVITLHAYYIPPKPEQLHEDEIREVLGYIDTLGKPTICTECCWFADTDEERAALVKHDLALFNKLGLGFCAHALRESPVFDLHPITDADDNSGVGGAYMAFIDKNGDIRKGHEIFNDYTVK